MELRQVAKYRIVERIGRGAMGEVYKAHDPVLNRFVALKMLSAQMVGDPEMRKRFEREAQSAARLNHANIITVYELGEETGQIFIAMELLDGSDLKDLIGSPALESLEAKLRVMEQVLDGVAFAHARQVVHRDLKPANIRLLPSGQLKVMDFGLARLTGSEMTQAGMVMGTPHYMSPEQVRGEVADARSDVFSLGGVFYELLCGTRPFTGEGLHTVLHKVLEVSPAPLRDLSPGVPEELAAVVHRALAKERELRYADAGEMLADLRALRGGLAAAGLAGASSWGRGVAAVAPRGGRVSRSMAATARALQPAEPAATWKPRPSDTLDGTGATVLRHAREERPSRLPLLAGAGAVLLVAGIGGVVAWRALRPAAPAAPAAVDSGALRESLVEAQLELARLSLANKSYEEAARQAEAALRQDPRSDEARRLVEQARQAAAERDAVVAAGRAALARGDVPAASRALTRLLALDPRHPAAGELSSALNASFRQQAAEAQAGVAAARAAAAKADARNEPAFAQAERLAREGDALLGTGEYAVATQRYVQARDDYAQAQRASEAAARRAAEVQRQEEARRQSDAQRLAEAQRQAEARRLAEEQQRLAAQRQATPPATAPVAPPASIAVPPSQPAPAGAEAAIRQVLADYARAIESQDVALFASVKPNLSGDERKRLEAAFKAIKSQQVRIAVESVQVAGTQATVRVARQDTINGKPQPPLQQTFRLALGPAGWKIEAIGQ
jgi:tRNA A-37 threonylcarbamoyl transferase component Bud32